MEASEAESLLEPERDVEPPEDEPCLDFDEDLTRRSWRVPDRRHVGFALGSHSFAHVAFIHEESADAV